MRHFGFSATEDKIKTTDNLPITAMDKSGKANQAQQLIHSKITELPEGLSPYDKTMDSNAPIVKGGKMKKEEDKILTLQVRTPIIRQNLIHVQLRMVRTQAHKMQDPNMCWVPIWQSYTQAMVHKRGFKQHNGTK